MDNNKIQFLRDRNNLFKADVARALGVSNSIYCRWENDICSMPTRRLIQLADFYKVNIDYLVGLTNDKITTKPVKFNKKLIAQRTKELRTTLNLTQENLAKKLGTTHSTWSAYENGKTLILSPFLIKLCGESNISIDYTLGRTNTKYIK